MKQKVSVTIRFDLVFKRSEPDLPLVREDCEAAIRQAFPSMADRLRVGVEGPFVDQVKPDA